MGRAENGMLWTWDLSRTLGWQGGSGSTGGGSGITGGGSGGGGGGNGGFGAAWALPGEGIGCWLCSDSCARQVRRQWDSIADQVLCSVNSLTLLLEELPPPVCLTDWVAQMRRRRPACEP